MDAMTELESAIPKKIEDLFDNRLCVIARKIPIDKKQIDIGAHAELFTPIASECGDTQGEGIFHRLVAFEHSVERYFVNKFHNFVYFSCVFEKKISPA